MIRDATAANTPALADLALRCPMHGAITVATVPGPRASAFKEFVTRKVMIAEVDGRIAGSVALDLRATSHAGERMPYTYVTDMRVAPEARRSRVASALLDAAVALDHRLGSHALTALTLGGNSAVERLIAAQWTDARQLATTTMIQWVLLGRGDARAASGARRATLGDLDAIHALQQRTWRERSFAPALTRDELAAEFQRDATFTLDDAAVVERGGRIVGFGALWDQRPLKEERVMAYAPPLRVLGTLVRAYAGIRGGLTLPPTGAPMPLAHLRYLAADDLDAARIVRDALLARARERQLLIVMLGLDSRDPLAKVARGRLHVPLRGTLWASLRGPLVPTVAQPALPAWVDYGVA